MNPSRSNYELMKTQMAVSFLQHDQDLMIRNFSLEHDTQYLYLSFVDRMYRISRESGQVEWSADFSQTANAADYNEAMTIYDVLCRSDRPNPASTELVPVNTLSSIHTGNMGQKTDFFQHAAEFFDGNTSGFLHACKALHGIPVSGGDAACELQFFSFLPVTVRFWESDEDFPPSLQILVPKNILDFMHYETVMFAVSHLLNRLMNETRNSTP